MGRWEYLEVELDSIYFRLSKRIGFEWLMKHEPFGEEITKDDWTDSIIKEISSDVYNAHEAVFFKPTFMIKPDKSNAEWNRLVAGFLDYLGSEGWEMVSKESKEETVPFRKIKATFKRELSSVDSLLLS